MNYPGLFREGYIGRLRLKNRVVMPAMGTMLASAEGEVTDHLIAYFEERAKGGVGLIITEVTSVEYSLGKAGAVHPRVDDNRFIPMLSRLANAIHKYDAKVFMQLHHAGRQTSSMLTGGRQSVAPSPIACTLIGETPQELTNQEIKDLVNRFVMGALRCKMAGIDGVELHGAHGYLINQFLSPQSNKRTDEYGGTFENRMRFTKEIVDGIRSTCGKDYPLIIRLSVEEFVEGGIDLPEGVRIARYMEEIGVDAINVSCGTYESIPTVIEPVTYEQGWRVYLSEAVKKAVNIPVISVGVIREPDFAESMLRERKSDFIGIGRGLIADPYWCEKASRGERGEIRKCMSCLHCLDGGLQGVHIGCAINARAGRELEFPELIRNGKQRKVVVVGGGPAGMEAARVLAARDFNVILFEKEGHLGGQINFGNKPRGKEKMAWLTDYLHDQLKRLGVEVKLNQEVDHESLRNENPYAVFVATGATPFLPGIAGIDGKNVLTAERALSTHASFKKLRVAVIGGGMTGCETAELIAANGNEVFLVEMLPEIAKGAGVINRLDLQKHLENAKVNIYTGHALIEIGEGSVLLENLPSRRRFSLDVDRVVVALGVRSDSLLFEKIKDTFKNVVLLGDARSPGKIADAIKEGYEKAFLLQ